MPTIQRVAFAALGLVLGMVTGAALSIVGLFVWVETHPKDFDSPVDGLYMISVLICAAIVGAVIGLAMGLVLPPLGQRRKLSRPLPEVATPVPADDETTWPPSPKTKPPE